MTEEVYHLPKTIEVTKTLDDSHLRAFFESIKSYNSSTARQTLGEGNNRVSSANNRFGGSSSFIQPYLLHMDPENQGVFPNRTRPVTRPDLERAVKDNKQFLIRNIADFGIVIWSAPETHEANKLPYETLVEQFRQRNIPLGNGKLVYFSELEKPREHGNSAYGLVLDLKDIPTDELKDNIRDINEFQWTWEKGNGLARACLGSWYWSCSNEHLGSSDSYCRVVGVGVEAPKNLTFGYSDEQLKTAFESAGVSPVYSIVEPHLPKQ